MSIPDRIAKLRRMAEHPTSNPHEAAIAREEMERLIRENPTVTATRSNPVIVAAHPWGFDETRYRTSVGQFRARNGWRPVEWSIEDQPRNTDYEFARSLKVGDKAKTAHSVSWIIYNGPIVRQEIVTVARMTATQYIMQDGSRYRRTGQFPGYKVGENGRDGHRTYLVRP